MQYQGIALAGANQACDSERSNADDGVLSAFELSLFDLTQTQLGVVSACYSALGDLDMNEGVYGLQRAFRIAGARNVICNLWQANDVASSHFMSTFYWHWLTQKKSIHEAFHAARNETRAYNPDPKYWAGFILSE